MPYYDSMKKKKMSREDHLRTEEKKERKNHNTRSFRQERTQTAGSLHSSEQQYGDSMRKHRDNLQTGTFRKDQSSPKAKLPVSERKNAQTHFQEPPENLLSGRNPIREALKTGRDIEKLLVAKGELSGTAKEIVYMAKEAHIPVQVVERSRLDEITPHHQGLLAFASAYAYAEVEDMLALAKEKQEDPFLVILDGVTDPQNLGAIIRSAACAGAHGVIVPARRAAGLTPTAVKASAGAVEHIKVARVGNLVNTLKELKKAGLWLFGADMQGQDYRKADITGAVALIVGSEGEGLSRLTKENCDHLLSIPTTGAVDSLNASVAAGILMFAIRSQRGL